MKKKIITLCLVIAMLSVAVIGGTLAYFTDEDQARNEFTVGKVSIDLYETVGHADATGVSKNDKITVPEGVESLVDIGKDTDEHFTVTYGPAMPGDTLTKVVTVENDGTEPAYVALAIKQENYGNFNVNLDDYYEGMGHDAVFMQGLMDELFREGAPLAEGSNTGWNRPMYDKTTNGTMGEYIATGIRYYPQMNAEGKAIGIDNKGATNYAENPLAVPTLLGVDYAVVSNNGGVKSAKGYTPMLPVATYDTMGMNERVWVYYLYMPAESTYTMDISIKVPNIIDENSIEAFNGMVLNVKTTAIQVTGWASAQEAFAELYATYPLTTDDNK